MLQGELRIAHCGGFHAAPFNVLVKAVNLVATLLGHPVHWDTETVSCTPPCLAGLLACTAGTDWLKLILTVPEPRAMYI